MLLTWRTAKFSFFLCMYLEINDTNPQTRFISQAVKCLDEGGIIIYPTDSIYGIGCDLANPKAIEKLCKLKQIKPNKLDLSFICQDLSQVAEYTRPFSNSVFKLLRTCVPGPYTFILESSSKVPKILGYPKKNVGVRIPSNKIIQAIVSELGRPIVNMSVKSDDEVLQYLTDPEEIYEKYKNWVDIVIGAGVSGNVPTTVISCTNGDIELIRKGLGDIDLI